MVYNLTYRRPERAGSDRTSLSGDEKQKSIRTSLHSNSSTSSHGIPEALSFDRIVNGGVCPVSSLPHVPATPRPLLTLAALHAPRLHGLPQVH
jgi:hypothetical protein